MEYTQKSIIFEYLSYESVIKMMHVDRDYKRFITPRNLFRKYFHDVRRLDYTYGYESLGCPNDSDGDDDFTYFHIKVNDLDNCLYECKRIRRFTKNKKLFLSELQRFEDIIESNMQEMEEGSTNEFYIRHTMTLYEDEMPFYRGVTPGEKHFRNNERFQFDNIVKFRKIMNKLIFK